MSELCPTWGKIRYASKGEADKAAKLLIKCQRRKDKDYAGSYKCTHCGDFHVTSQRPGTKPPIKTKRLTRRKGT